MNPVGSRLTSPKMTVAVAILWLAGFTLTYTFPVLNATTGPAGTFWLYPMICGLGVILIRCTLPETRHKTLEQIECGLMD